MNLPTFSRYLHDSSMLVVGSPQHRSINGFMVNMLGGLIAYCLKDNKPALDLKSEEIELMECKNIVIA